MRVEKLHCSIADFVAHFIAHNCANAQQLRITSAQWLKSAENRPSAAHPLRRGETVCNTSSLRTDTVADYFLEEFQTAGAL